MPRILLVIMAVLLTTSLSQAQVLDDGANMKILKARAKLLHMNKEKFTKELDGKVGLGDNLGGRVNCGSVEVGNQVATGGIGRDIEIIITGDIINTDNHCVNTRN